MKTKTKEKKVSVYRQNKIKEVEQFAKKLANCNVVIISEYRGLNVSEMTELRKKLRKINTEYKVFKNTLINRALKSISKLDENIEKLLNGPIAVALNPDDPVTLSKVLIDYSKEHENLKIKGGILESKFLSFKDINSLASLPSRDVLIAKVVNGMKSPINKLVFALKGILSKFVYTLEAVKTKKQ